MNLLTIIQAYLKDFFRLSQALGGLTAEVMKVFYFILGLCWFFQIFQEILYFEADRRAINITVNSIGTELSRDERHNLFSDFGSLHPQGYRDLALCSDFEQVISVLTNYSLFPDISHKATDGEINLDKVIMDILGVFFN